MKQLLRTCINVN